MIEPDDEDEVMPGDVGRLRSNAHTLVAVLARVGDTLTIWSCEVDFPVQALRAAVLGHQRPPGRGTWLGDVHIDAVTVVKRAAFPAEQAHEILNTALALRRLENIDDTVHLEVAAAMLADATASL